MIYCGYKVYGPYKWKDGRWRVILKNLKQKQKTVSYPKYIVELHLGRYLKKMKQFIISIVIQIIII